QRSEGARPGPPRRPSPPRVFGPRPHKGPPPPPAPGARILRAPGCRANSEARRAWPAPSRGNLGAFPKRDETLIWGAMGPWSSSSRSVGFSRWRGLAGRCQNCGKGKLFYRSLKVEPKCRTCGHDLDRYPSDDGPAYFTILIVGHLVIAP